VKYLLPGNTRKLILVASIFSAYTVLSVLCWLRIFPRSYPLLEAALGPCLWLAVKWEDRSCFFIVSGLLFVCLLLAVFSKALRPLAIMIGLLVWMSAGLWVYAVSI
jgi:hypothetical protein